MFLRVTSVIGGGSEVWERKEEVLVGRSLKGGNGREEGSRMLREVEWVLERDIRDIRIEMGSEDE